MTAWNINQTCRHLIFVVRLNMPWNSSLVSTIPMTTPTSTWCHRTRGIRSDALSRHVFCQEHDRAYSKHHRVENKVYPLQICVVFNVIYSKTYMW
jgi:hypothetical protein